MAFRCSRATRPGGASQLSRADVQGQHMAKAPSAEPERASHLIAEVDDGRPDRHHHQRAPQGPLHAAGEVGSVGSPSPKDFDGCRELRQEYIPLPGGVPSQMYLD